MSMPLFVITLTDVIGLVLFCLVVLAVICFALFTIIRQALCGHKRVYENMRCNAVCSDCHKDLGFIETYRAKQTKEQS